MNLAEILTHSAARQPDRAAIKLDDSVLSYADLEQSATRVVALLHEHGVVPGDRVAIMLPNVPQFPICYYGALRAGAVVVPMNVLNKRREVKFYLEDSGAKLLFVWNGFAEEGEGGAQDAGTASVVITPGEFEQTLAGLDPVAELEDRDASDTAVVLYTSGTTGTPKGAELTHANLRRNCELARDLFDLDGSVVLGALPLFHSFGQTCGLNATVVGGGTLTLIPRFDPVTALEIIGRDQVTVFEGVPTMYNAMLHTPDRERFDTASLRICASGGAAMPVELMRGFEQAFGVKVLEGYGLSETSPVASFNHPDRERKPGSIGTPVDGVELRLVDEDNHEVALGEVGEIAIRGHNVMKGYWRRPEATAEAIDADGWFHSGDMARIDEDGYYFIVDRKKDMIIRGGFNVYPREIEEVLYEHPAVREVAVVGIPHETHGEEVAAAVALTAGAEVTADELREFAKSQVAAYKYPRKIWFVDELPKGPTGKILKREIVPPSGPSGS